MDILTISSVNLLLGLSFFLSLFLYCKNSTELKHFRIFSLAGLCLALNSLIVIVNNIVTLPIYLMPALANAATVGLHCIVLLGVLTLCKLHFRVIWFAIPVLLSFSLSFFEPFKTEMAMRLMANYLLIIMLNALSFKALQSVNKSTIAFTVFKAVLIFNVLQLFSRGLLYVLFELEISQLAQHLIVHQFGWFAFTIYCSGLLASCLLLLVESQQKELERKANTDPLTGLLNRNDLNSILNKEISRCIRQGEAITVMMLDVDFFKRINDTYGHSTGDVALQHIAELLRQHFRNYDLLFRIGGEEFLACLPNVDAPQARCKLEQLRQTFLQQPVKAQEEIPITVSMGWVSTRQKLDGALLLKRADEALYQAKKLGRNKVLEAEAL